MSDSAVPHASTTATDLAAARLVRRTLQQWPLIVACTVVAALVAFGVAQTQTKQYESTTTVQLSEVDLASVFTGQSLQQQGDDSAAKAATNAKLVVMPGVREATVKLLGGGLSTGDIERAIKVTPTAGTTLVDIVAKGASPVLAARIADATRVAFVQVRTASAVAQFDQATVRVRAQLARIPESQQKAAGATLLRDRLQQIDTLRAVSNGGVQTVQTARVSASPVSPKPKRALALGLVLGALLGSMIALLRARLDQKVRDTDDLASLWELPVVGLIPETDGLRQADIAIPDGPALEALSLARTNLRYLHVGGTVKTLLLTSALEGEGKSTITWNLAIAAAIAKSRVLVIEADLRRPVISARLGIGVKSGLSEILAGIATEAESIVAVSLEDSTRGVSVNVDVLPAGLAPPSPIALLESEDMTDLLGRLKANYDIILIDTPPATIVADAMAFMDHVDGVLIVSRLGRLRRASMIRLRRLLEGINAPVLGQIVNSGASAKAYGYTAYTGSRTASQMTTKADGRPSQHPDDAAAAKEPLAKV